MIPRAALVSLFAICLVCFPAIASQPDGLAGKFITYDREAPDSPCFPGNPGVELSDYSGPWQVDPTDTVTLSLAILPFPTGSTSVGLDEGVNGWTFVGIRFENGLVDGLPYNRSGWNDVTLQAHPASQDFDITVNGLRAGPFPYGSACQSIGGCFSVAAFRLNADPTESGSVAWIDSVSVYRSTTSGVDLHIEETYDSCAYPPKVTGAGLVLTAPPRRLGPKR